MIGVARTVFVADDDKTAERYGRSDAASPYKFYYSQMHAVADPQQAAVRLQVAPRAARRPDHA